VIALFSARFLIEFLKYDQVAFEAGMSFNMEAVVQLTAAEPHLMLHLCDGKKNKGPAKITAHLDLSSGRDACSLHCQPGLV
jgi:hypothetical protein